MILFFLFSFARALEVNIGAKAFTEGYVLGEYAAQVLEHEPNTTVNRRFGLGGTGILFQALKAGQIDFYPEYTGTIVQTMLNPTQARTIKEINVELAPLGLTVSRSLGFSNGYGLAVTKDFARAHHLVTLSDLRQVEQTARIVLSSEFMSRADGYNALKARYQYHFGDNLRSLEHSLAYEAIRKQGADVIDVYTTDAKIEKLDLIVLKDDLKFFPLYEAVLLARRPFTEENPKQWHALQTHLVDRFTEPEMRHLNGLVDIDKKPVPDVVAEARGAIGRPVTSVFSGQVYRIAQRTREHLVLVGLALAFSVLIGVPLGILADQRRKLGQVILLLSGTIQTIPSLALLCFLIPVFGIGLKPALVALCLYGLLPVVLNTVIGLGGIDPQLRNTAKALGLGFWDRLFHIELPLASPNILAGIKTSAIVGIGTATLAALIGAGGYGASIVAGLAINDTGEILLGAVPAAGMALLAYAIFAILERFLIPRGLR